MMDVGASPTHTTGFLRIRLANFFDHVRDGFRRLPPVDGDQVPDDQAVDLATARFGQCRDDARTSITIDAN